MAQPNIELFTRRALLLKEEPTEGTDSAPVVGTDAFQLMEGKSTLEFDKIERKLDRPYLGGQRFGVINTRAGIEGGFELVPPSAPGTDSAAAKVLLAIAGMTEVKDAVGDTTRYHPVSTGFKSATAWWYHAGTLRKALGSRANISGLSLAVGSWFKGQTKIQGSCSSVLEAALPGGIDYSAFKDPVYATDENTTLLIGADADGDPTLHLWGKELSIDFGNDLKSKMFTEKKVNSISNRAPTFKLRCARPAKADFDAWALQVAGELIVAEFRLTHPDTLYSALGIRGQIEKVDEVEVDGDYLIELSGNCVPSDAGNDEFYVEFGGALG